MNAISNLKTDYKEDISLKDALIMAVKTLAKSMDGLTPDASKFEVGVVTRDALGNVVQRKIEGAELTQILEDAKIGEEVAAVKK